MRGQGGRAASPAAVARPSPSPTSAAARAAAASLLQRSPPPSSSPLLRDVERAESDSEDSTTSNDDESAAFSKPLLSSSWTRSLQHKRWQRPWRIVALVAVTVGLVMAAVFLVGRDWSEKASSDSRTTSAAIATACNTAALALTSSPKASLPSSPLTQPQPPLPLMSPSGSFVPYLSTLSLRGSLGLAPGPALPPSEKYLLFQVAGRFNNGRNSLLHALAFARILGRTLILPEIKRYNHRLAEFIDLERLQAVHPVVSYESLSPPAPAGSPEGTPPPSGYLEDNNSGPFAGSVVDSHAACFGDVWYLMREEYESDPGQAEWIRAQPPALPPVAFKEDPARARFLLDELGEDSPAGNKRLITLGCPWPQARLSLAGLPAPMVAAMESWTHDAVRYTPALLGIARRIREHFLPKEYIGIHWRLGDFEGRPSWPKWSAEGLAGWVKDVVGELGDPPSTAPAPSQARGGEHAAPALEDGNWTVYIAAEDPAHPSVQALCSMLRETGKVRPVTWLDLAPLVHGPLKAFAGQNNPSEKLLAEGASVGMIEVLLLSSALRFQGSSQSTLTQAVLELRLHQVAHRCEALGQLQEWDEHWQRFVAISYPPSFGMPFRYRSENGAENATGIVPGADESLWHAAHPAERPKSPFVASYFSSDSDDEDSVDPWLWPSDVAPLPPSPPCPDYSPFPPANLGFKPPLPMSALAERVLRRFHQPWPEQMKQMKRREEARKTQGVKQT